MSVKHTHLNRRELMGVAGGAVAVAATGSAALAGPARPVSTSRHAWQDANLPTPREETVVIETEPINVWDSFNPFIPNGEAYNYGLASICREYMFYVNFLTGEVTPWLAEEYTYNDDYTACTLKLNPGVTWSDGKPFTADDVVFTQQMLLDNPSLNGAAGLIDTVKSISADDDHTVTWQLTRPNTRFHYMFLAGIIADGLRVMPKHIWEGEDPGTFKFNPPVQTGPYVLKESSSTKLYYLWEKAENYWNKANLDPKPNYVLFRLWTEVDASVQEFLAGNLDYSHRLNLDYLNQEVIAGQRDDISRFNFTDPCPRAFHLNVDSPSGLFKTPEGRWAFSYLIDRETISNTIWQPPTVPATYQWADYEGWKKWAPDEVMSQFDLTYNLDKANELLDKIGATERDGNGIRILDGKPLKLTIITPMDPTDPHYQMALFVANSAKDAGLDFEVKSLPGSAHWDAFDNGDFDVSAHWVCGMQFDPIQLYGWYHSDNYFPVGERTNRGNDVRLQSPELDELIDKLRDLDPEDDANMPVFNDALTVFEQQLPTIATNQMRLPVLFSTGTWQGWPTEDNPYSIPADWWGHWLFVIGKITPAGS